jgi:hypothetical protein
MQMKPVLAAACILAVMGGVSFSPLADHAHAQQAPQTLPPLQYTCPMHPEVLEDKPGSCHICKMALEPTRIDTELNYSCPSHAAVITQKPGQCPIDRRELVPVVVTLHWICAESPDQKLMEPGKCASGGERKLVRAIRAHGDHNPRHGGLFYMAQDQWHHLEGTLPRQGLFRAFFYDNYTQPIDAKNFTGTVTLQELNPSTGATKDLATFPLRLSADGKTLEAALKNDKAPAKDAPIVMTAKLRLTKDGPEQPFLFTFAEYSKEPASAAGAATSAASAGRPPSAPAATTSAATAGRPTSAPAAATAAATPKPPSPSPAPTTAVQAPTQTPAATEAPAVAPAQPIPTITNCEPNMTRTDALLLSDALPRNSKMLLELLGMCSAEVQKLVQGAQYGFVYQPTMLGKDIALALENYVGELPSSRRTQAAEAIRKTVLAAWQLDMYGDMGNQAKITDAYEHFAAAIAEVKTAYGAN